MVQDTLPASTVNEPVKKPRIRGEKGSLLLRLSLRTCIYKKYISAAPVYLCPFSRKACVDIDEIICEEANSIQCHKCNEWMHWSCVGYTNNVSSDEWFCTACTYVISVFMSCVM